MQTKILDIKGANWLDGISAQANIPLAGRFQGLDNIDPFDLSGTAQPSLSPVTTLDVSLFNSSNPPRYLTIYNNGGISTIIAHGDTKCVEYLANSPYTATDKTAGVTISNPVAGAITWKGKYVYARVNEGIFSNTLPVTTDTQIFATENSTTVPFCIGADKNLYFGQGTNVGQLTSATGTAGNTGTFFGIDSDCRVRDLVNDGQYLVILADNNEEVVTSRTAGNYRCRVYFVDYGTTTVTGNQQVVYDIDDSYLISAKIIGGVIYIIGYNGIYTCSLGNPPKLIRSFVNSGSLTLAKPFNPYQVGVHNGTMYWLEGGSDSTRRQNIYAYGNPIAGHQKIFYTPYKDTGAGSYTQKALTISGSQIWVSESKPQIAVHNAGSTRGTSTISSIGQTMPTTYRYEYTKVVLNTPLSSGQSVQVTAVTQTSGRTISTETISYNASNPKQVLMFRNKGGTANPLFEDIRITVTAVAGATILRVTAYATPQPDDSESI